MVLDIKNNRSELIEANDQLDQRRQFSEAVLSGVYSGVIGLDKNFKINLPNKTAEKLLEINIPKHYNKKNDINKNKANIEIFVSNRFNSIDL